MQVTRHVDCSLAAYRENLLSNGAANRTRTCDPVITNDVLYQLSYCGEPMQDALAKEPKRVRT